MTTDSIDWVKGQAAIRPDAAALEIGGNVTTYRELDAEADGYAAELTRRGVGRGHLLRFPAAFDRTSVVVIVAGPRAGVAIAPQPTHTSTHLDRIDQGGGGGAPARVVLDTSGTGGRRRSCVLTSGNVAAAVAASRGRLGNGSDDRWLLCLPLHHVAGVSILWRSFEAGGTVVIEAGFDADRVARRLAEGSVTFASLVPTMLHRILRSRPGPYRNHLGAVLVGGAGAGTSVVREALDAGLPVLPTYGMTEACSQIATVAPGRARQDLGTVGTPLDTMTVSIRSAQGEPCPPGTTGRIVVAGPAVSPGNLGEPHREGVHVTGDLGHFDAEGRLVVVGRSDDMVISGGENVMPLAIAEVIEQNPAVHRCAVFGVPDPEWGQVVAAAVTGEALDEQRLRGWAELRLSPAEVPRVWLIKDDLPELETGKVDTDGLRAELAG
jgi:O-succinylbenzoic acid--CoA ligase